MKVFFVPLAVALFVSLAGCHQSNEPAASEQAISAPTVVVQASNARQSITVSGTVKAHFEADLAAQIVAPVAVVTKREGDHFRKGDVLVRLHAPALDAQAAQAAASLQSAAKQADAAEVQAKLTAATLERYAQLRERHSVTSYELDQVKAQSAAAAAQQQNAVAQVAAARATLSAQRANAADTVLYAPFDGVVARRLVDPGTMASPGVPLLHLQSVGQEDVEFSIPDSSLSDLRSGSTLRVRTNGTDSIEARVASIAPAGDSASHTFLVKATLPTSSSWNAGTVAQVSLPSHSQGSALLVPNQALVQQGGLDAVMVVASDSRASVRYVTLAGSVGDAIEVLTGLRPGDRILAHGDLGLAGRKIEVRP
ncbi:MAG: efflux RND transporter periplasmic adaptor subunit [Acidobacteriota bacterium]